MYPRLNVACGGLLKFCVVYKFGHYKIISTYPQVRLSDVTTNFCLRVHPHSNHMFRQPSRLLFFSQLVDDVPGGRRRPEDGLHEHDEK